MKQPSPHSPLSVLESNHRIILPLPSCSERPLFLLPLRTQDGRTDGPKLGEAGRNGRGRGKEGEEGEEEKQFPAPRRKCHIFSPRKNQAERRTSASLLCPTPRSSSSLLLPSSKLGLTPPRAKHSFTGRRRRKPGVISGGFFRRSSLRYISGRETPSWRNEMSERG